MARRRSSRPGAPITPRAPQAMGAGTAGPTESWLCQQSWAPSPLLPLPDHLPHGVRFGPGHPLTGVAFFPRGGRRDPRALATPSHVLLKQAAWQPEVTRRHRFPMKAKPGAVWSADTGGKEGMKEPVGRGPGTRLGKAPAGATHAFRDRSPRHRTRTGVRPMGPVPRFHSPGADSGDRAMGGNPARGPNTEHAACPPPPPEPRPGRRVRSFSVYGRFGGAPTIPHICLTLVLPEALQPILPGTSSCFSRTHARPHSRQQQAGAFPCSLLLGGL